MYDDILCFSHIHISYIDAYTTSHLLYLSIVYLSTFPNDSGPHQYLRIIVVFYFHRFCLLLPTLHLINFGVLSIFQIQQIYLKILCHLLPHIVFTLIFPFLFIAIYLFTNEVGEEYLPFIFFQLWNQCVKPSYYR